MATTSLEIGLNPEDSLLLLLIKLLPALEQPSFILADSSLESLEGPGANFEIDAALVLLPTIFLPALGQESQLSSTVLYLYLWGSPPPPYSNLLIIY